MFPEEYLLVTYIERNEHECETWILEFLYPVEEKAKVLKMQEIINGTLQYEKYQIVIQNMVFEDESYYKGFIHAKTNYEKKIALEILSYKNSYVFNGLLNTLPNEEKLLYYINNKFDKEFTDLTQIIKFDNEVDDDDDNVRVINYEYINLDDIYYKCFTDDNE
jgi:hypothetical protein